MLNHFVYKKNISKRKYLQIFTTDNPSEISSITRELDLKTKDKQYISIAWLCWLIFEKKSLQNSYLIIILATIWGTNVNDKLGSVNSKHFQSTKDKVTFLKPIRNNIEFNAVKTVRQHF